MRYLGNKRRLAALGAVGAVVGVTLWAVLPAVASNVGDYVGPASTTYTVLPKDVAVGGNGNCSNLFPNLTGVSEYDNSNPKNGTFPSGNGDQVTFTITFPTGKDHDKYFSFSAAGAAVLGLGVNGGSDSTTYDYTQQTDYVNQSKYTGSATSDAGLHAPAQSWGGSGTFESPEQPTQLFSVSHLTFCYVLGSVKGTVYQDNDLSGDQSSGDTSLPNWTVTLYDGASTAVRSTKSASDGSYTLSAAFTNPPYTVCEAPPSGSWAQTEPDPQKPNVCPTGQLPKGYQFTPSGITDQIVGDDFGNVPAQGCTTGPFGPANYQLGTCKPTNSYVFSSGTLNTDQSYVAYWTGDQTQPEIPQVENVTLDDPIVSNQPKYTGLMYSNAGGVVNVSTTTLAPMPYCLLDPRTGEYTLDSAYTTVWDGTLPRTGSGLVLPGTDTACAISIKTYVDASGKGHLQAYVYALGDSIRSVG